MANKISNFVFLILLFLLQSCSGGKIGNFLESSFKNNNSDKILQSDIDEETKKDIISKDKKLFKKENIITNFTLNEESKPLNISNSISNEKNDENIRKKLNKNFKPKSYRIFVILNKVDPSFPTEKFSKVLRNGDINFVIEKIELIPELNQSKK